LFIVGDEKQSIYGFRDADLKVFSDAKKRIQSSNKKQSHFSFGEELLELNENESKGIITLPENYRILPNILAFVNHLFNSLFIPTENIGENNFENAVEYNELIYGREVEDSGKIELLLIDESQQISEAEIIAQKIIELINNKTKIYKKKKDREELTELEFCDIGILFRERKDFKDFEREFAKRKIPYVISGGKGYFQTEEITDWINYFKFLNNPNDDIAFLSILRSPFFSISDEDLFKISSIKVQSSFYDKFTSFVYENPNEEILFDVYNKLSKHLEIAGRVSLPILIQMILTSTCYEGNILEEERQNQISANIEKLLDHAREFEALGFSDLFDFVEYLKTNWEDVEDVSEAQINESLNSVSLITIHQAKGLEFPLVIIPKCSDKLKSYSLNYGALDV
ncbi:MAG: UvrD-helicase domain-containing protein, partial [Ignavibacteria bacterium]|nr:UvrD-helicase domain-containing protein [Ignavibacteria bacterium]